MEDKLKHLIDTYLSPIEKELVEAFYFNKMKSSQIYKSLGIKKSTYFYKKNNIIKKLKLFNEIDKQYSLFLQDDKVIDLFSATELQFLYYFVLLYDKFTIKNKMRCGHEAVSKYRKQIYDKLYNYYPILVRLLIDARKKRYKSGVKGMKLALFDFPIFAIRNRAGNLCSQHKDRLTMWQDKYECIKVMKKEDPECDKKVSRLILFEFSSIQEFAWIIKRNKIMPIEITMFNGNSLFLEVSDVQEIISTFGNRNPFKEGFAG